MANATTGRFSFLLFDSLQELAAIFIVLVGQRKTFNPMSGASCQAGQCVAAVLAGSKGCRFAPFKIPRVSRALVP